MKPWRAVLLLLLTASAACAAPPALQSVRPKRIELSWTTPAGVTAYHLWRRAEGKERWEQIATIDAEATTYADTSVTARTAYSYRLEVVGTAPDPGVEVGPITALAPFYVALRSVEGAVASLRVHKWDAGFGEWLESDIYSVEAGEPIGVEQMLADFRTKATLEKASVDPQDPTLARVTFVTEEGAKVTVTSRDKLPEAVLPKKEKKADEKEPATVTRTREPTTPGKKPGLRERTLRFPEPRKAGAAPGTKVRWDITNETELSMTVLIQGVTAKRAFKIGPDKTFTTTLKRGGNFTIVIHAEDNSIVPMRGDFGLASGTQYESTIKILQQDPTKD